AGSGEQLHADSLCRQEPDAHLQSAENVCADAGAARVYPDAPHAPGQPEVYRPHPPRRYHCDERQFHRRGLAPDAQLRDAAPAGCLIPDAGSCRQAGGKSDKSRCPVGRKSLSWEKGMRYKAAFAIKPTNMSNAHRDDNYLPCDRYQLHLPDPDGFARFQDAESGQWYFAWYALDEVVLRSEGYVSEEGRDQGIDAVRRYKDDEASYRVQRYPDGAWALEIMAAKHTESARSCR